MNVILVLIRSKTMLWSLGLVVLGVLEANTSMLRPYFTPEVFPYIVVAIGVVTGLLRMVTTQALSEKV
jgi:hypothetical protein